MFIIEIVSDCQEIYTRALLVVNNYISGFLSGNQCLFLFDTHSKSAIGRISATSTVILLKSDSLQSLENHIKSVYYSFYPMIIYFQGQSFKLRER